MLKSRMQRQIPKRLISFIMMENDIMSKVLGLKEQKWSEEKEWRKVIEFKDGVEVLRHNGKPYTKYYLDKSHLTGVTVFCSSNTFDKARRDADEINHYISERGYSADVRVEIYE